MKYSVAISMLLASTNAKLSPTEVSQIYKGVMIGALQTEDLGDFVTCTITDGEKVTKDIEDAVTQLQKHSITGTAKGLEDIADALATINSGIKLCSSQKDLDQLLNLEDLLVSFKNPLTFTMHVGHDIMVNGRNIAGQISDALTSYKSGDYEKFGQDIGDSLTLVFLGTDQKETDHKQEEQIIMDNLKATPKDVEQIIMGVLDGAVRAEGLENVEGCIKDSEAFFSDALSAVQDFEKKSVSGVTSGIKKLGAALRDAKDAIKQCEGVEADVVALEKMLEVFNNPHTFAFHVGKDLMINGVQIYKEINDAVKQFESANYFEFGEDLGLALAQLIFGAPIEMLELAEDSSIEPKAINIEEPQLFII